MKVQAVKFKRKVELNKHKDTTTVNLQIYSSVTYRPLFLRLFASHRLGD
jgi:hypothetical protein